MGWQAVTEWSEDAGSGAKTWEGTSEGWHDLMTRFFLSFVFGCCFVFLICWQKCLFSIHSP
jgi:hypothetical protein